MYLPAVKVGRLAVDEAFRAQNRGTGEALMRHAFLVALTVANVIGCRLLTVDAYPASVGFYERLGFVLNKTAEGPRNTTSMRLDLRSLPSWVKLKVVD
jgi:ribosomal protein S18 acetylase RimI-like enzyme